MDGRRGPDGRGALGGARAAGGGGPAPCSGTSARGCGSGRHGDLVEKLLGALAGEDRKRIDATLVPGAVTRGNPRALETATDIIVQHALEGARLHPGEEGYVTLTLVQESDGVHVTCLDHGPEGDRAGNRRSLALIVARSLIEGQGGEMEITPYPRYGTMVRLRLPPAPSSM